MDKQNDLNNCNLEQVFAQLPATRRTFLRRMMQLAAIGATAPLITLEASAQPPGGPGKGLFVKGKMRLLPKGKWVRVHRRKGKFFHGKAVPIGKGPFFP